MKKAVLLSISIFLVLAAATPPNPPLRYDFDTAIPADEHTSWAMLNYRLPEAFDLTARQLVRKTPIDRRADLTVDRYVERPEDGMLIHLGTFRTPCDDQPLRIPVSYFATHWFVVSDGANTAVKYLAFSDRQNAHLETSYIEEKQEQLYPVATSQK